MNQHILLRIWGAVLLMFMLVMGSCTFEFANPYDPLSANYVGDDLAADTDGDGLAAWNDVDELRLAAPAAGATVSSAGIAFSINALNPDRITKYDYQVSSANTFASPEFTLSDSSSTGFSLSLDDISTFTNNTSWYWRARAWDNTLQQWGGWTAARKFVWNIPEGTVSASVTWPVACLDAPAASGILYDSGTTNLRYDLSMTVSGETASGTVSGVLTGTYDLVVIISDGGTTKWTQTTAVEFTGSPWYSTYELTVSDLGRAPDAPGTPSAQASYDSVDLSWTQTNIALTDTFEIQYSKDGQSTWTTLASDLPVSQLTYTHASIPAADQGTEYSYRIRAANSAGNSAWSAITTVSIPVYHSVTSISLDQDTLDVMRGNTAQLTATVWPLNASNKGLAWSSDNPSIATVSATGLVQGIAKGSTVIRAVTQEGSFEATCTVTVLYYPVESIAIDQTSLSVKLGETGQLSVSFTPSNANNQNVTWLSTDTGVATVDSTGLVSGIGLGSATIRAISEEGSFVDECTVTVWSTGSVSIGFDFALNQTVSFTESSISVVKGQAVALSTSNSTLTSSGNNWQWWVNGTKQSTSSSFTLDTSSLVPGSYLVTLLVSYGNVLYSGSCTVTVTDGYYIGGKGPAGGYIFYDKGTYSDGWRYLEAAPSDQSSGLIWYNGTASLVSDAADTTVGSGLSNTTAIVDAYGSGSYAASLCFYYSYGGCSDWFLPSSGELVLMQSVLFAQGIASFNQGNYWSSTQVSAAKAKYVTFSSAYLANGNTSSTFYVRAIRRF